MDAEMKDPAHKIVLGTVQFGCRYGINSAGRPTDAMVREILTGAVDAGIRTLDTSCAYGNAEEVLGKCMPEGTSFRIVSKYPAGSPPVAQTFEGSLLRLGVTHLYGYLLHHFDLYRRDPGIWEAFMALKEQGKADKVGFSLYSPEELELILADGIPFDLVQLPCNIFDRKFLPYMKELHGRGVEIHVRSTFLQGLFFKDRDSLPQKLLPLRKYLLKLDEFSKESGLGIPETALNFNLQNPYIDGVLIGVDNPGQLQANLASVSDIPVDLEIDVEETELLNPVNWN